jgi:hypothetical protein
MTKISFFTPICYNKTTGPHSKSAHENIDNYFFLGGKKAQVIPSTEKDNKKEVCLIYEKPHLAEIVLK